MNPNTLLWIQGIYFGVTAIWPLLHMPSFLKVTGPKTDLWLVRVVALLLLAITAAFLLEALSETSPALPVIVLAISSSGFLMLADIYYVSVGRISRVYLLDALAEGLLLVGWGIALTTG